MNKLGTVPVGNSNPVRIMGIINTSPESFYKKSIVIGRQIAAVAKKMEEEGADFIDVGGMSTAPYLSTIVSEKIESKRVTDAIKIIQNVTSLPISVDTCRASVAKEALKEGAKILNDISGLKYDKSMLDVVSRFQPSLVLCAHSKKPVKGNNIAKTKDLLKESLALAKKAGVSKKNIALDPAIGFFRRSGKGPFFTKINSDWVERDLLILQNLCLLKSGQPLLVSVSNKSFIGKLLKKDPTDRLFGSLAAEVVAVLNGADIIRTHNVKETRQAVFLAQKFLRKLKKGL
ncbi:MAG: dihydropteroate synthase [Nitrososphaerota archaeon]